MKTSLMVISALACSFLLAMTYSSRAGICDWNRIQCSHPCNAGGEEKRLNPGGENYDLKAFTSTGFQWAPGPDNHQATIYKKLGTTPCMYLFATDCHKTLNCNETPEQ